MYQVLLVDDEPAAISMERRIIQRKTEKFQIAGEVYGVDEAIAMYEKLKPEVILTDMKMPKKSGVELIKYVMQQGESNVICVAVSGYSDFDYVHDAFSYGAFDYLLKPLDPKKVEAVFRQIEKVLDEDKGKEDISPLPPAGKISDQKMVEVIEKFIRKNLSGNNSILTICNTFGINQPYLSRIFKNCCNCTYNEFLTNIRIEEAKKMLETDEYLIGQIAEFTGFNGQFYFSRVFKNSTGYTPKEYRSKMQEERTGANE